MSLLVALGAYAKAELGNLLIHAWNSSKPEISSMLTDPSGVVSRMGDTLLWTTPNGQKVIGGLETLAESQGRIESAVVGIETAQIAMQGSLGIVQSVSIATLGITSLSGAFMAYRLQALNKRIADVRKSIVDVEGKIDAQHKAHIKSSLQYLSEYDNYPDDTDKLKRALDEARRASNIYGEIAMVEATSQVPRLPILNCRGRLHIVSLLTELRCLMQLDDSKRAIERIEEEEQALKAVAQACFDLTLKGSPERYLRSSFQSQGVSLGLLSSVYRQAKLLSIIDDPEIMDASDLFEYLRGRSWQGLFGIMKEGIVDDEIKKLRFLLSCLEETSKVQGLKLMIGEVHNQKGSLLEMITKLREWKSKQETQEQEGHAPPVFAYSL